GEMLPENRAQTLLQDAFDALGFGQRHRVAEIPGQLRERRPPFSFVRDLRLPVSGTRIRQCSSQRETTTVSGIISPPSSSRPSRPPLDYAVHLTGQRISCTRPPASFRSSAPS